ncbi:MAG TPA: amino acid adenylation domain-containing protein, partial [Roseiflexaceae bacterium]|nr:amino acid adenylation domain-containing protein [Roseiflexaceae bacterium]
MSDQQDALWRLSAAQHGIWAGQQLAPDSPLYNTAECVEISGPLDPALFEQALRQAVGEAEALHARVVVTPEGPRQRIAPVDGWALHTADLSDEADPWAAAVLWMHRDLATPVDLAQGPLFAQALFRAGPARFFWYQRVHHVALDGYGVALLARRTAELYSALAEGQPARGGPLGRLLPVLEEDAAYHASADWERDRAFWTARLADRPTPASLARHPAPAAGSLRQTAALSPEADTALRAAARSLGVGWPDLLIAAFAAYLHRAAGADEAVLGLPVMGRLGSAALRVACMAMNIIPLRLALRPEASLADLARQTAGEMRATKPHQRYRYEQLRRDLRLIGGERRLFGPVVNIMPFDTDLRFAGAPAVTHNLSAGPVEDLSLGVRARTGAPLLVELDANPACYRADELAEHARGFLALLDELIAQSDRPIGRPRSAALDGGPLPVPPRSVVEQIAARAQERPEAIALEYDGARVSYRELVDRANKLADRLAARGAGPDQLVAVLLPRGPEALLAILGTLFAGAGYLPLDPHGPAARNAAILDEAAPAVIITETAYAAAVPAQHADRALLLDAPEETAAPPHHGAAANADQLAYVIYTSGSTGQPKGVQISRGALAAFVAGATARYGIERADRVLQFAPLHFDASVEEIFLALCAGATLVLRDEAMLQSLPRFLAACAERAISVLDLPTAFWHELAYSLAAGAALPETLRLVIIGGEAALPARVAQWRAAVGQNVRLLNTYGPTEATVVATAADLSAEEDSGPDTPAPIGLPLPGVQAHVLDQALRPVPPGAVGELYLGGAALARGYLGQPSLTAERFIPFGEEAPSWGLGAGGENQEPRTENQELGSITRDESNSKLKTQNSKLYKTGDLVRQRPDGQLMFVGRADEEFKISGHRVHPAEIERVLLACPGVREAAVVGQVLPDGTRRLAAHIVADGPVGAAELRGRVQAALPAALVPGAFVFADRLPRSSTGKIDRSALRTAGLEQAGTAPATTNPLEQTLLRIWEQVLGQSGLSAEDDFFE